MHSPNGRALALFIAHCGFNPWLDIPTNLFEAYAIFGIYSVGIKHISIQWNILMNWLVCRLSALMVGGEVTGLTLVDPLLFRNHLLYMEIFM